MTTPKQIALKDLTLWKGNVRRTNPDEGIEALAASIKATGLLQSLAVIPRGKTFAVVAGGRRLAALELLRDEGHLADTFSVPCNVLEDERALEASLAENAMRLAMHPADQFEAFRGLIKQGLSTADVAARFGVSDRIVEQRLKLARVHPAILKAYRDGDTDLECVMAFAVVDDGKAQLRLWKSLSEHQRTNAGRIRHALTEHEIDATDRRVRFVTLAAYEAGGGTTRRDLFTDGDEGVFLLHPDLLNELVRNKLEDVVSTVAAEGWAWTEIREDFDYGERASFRRIHPETQLPPALQEELETLEAERERLYESAEDGGAGRIDEIDGCIDDIEAESFEVWPEGTREAAGAIVTIGYNGETEILRGLVRPEDSKTATPAKPRDPGALSKSLTRSLKAQRSAALSAALIQRGDIALAAVVHTMMCDVFLVGESNASCLRIASNPGMPDDEASRARDTIAQARTAWEARIPQTTEDLWHWCLKQEQRTLLDLLAFCTALSINAISYEDALFGTALDLDMREWFTPTEGNYFSRVSRAQILDALREARGAVAPAWDRAKKSELAAIAERELAGSGWLPVLLRAP